MDNDNTRNDAGENESPYNPIAKSNVQFDLILGATAATVGVIAKDFLVNQMGYHCILNPTIITSPVEMPLGIFYDVTENQRVVVFVDYATYDDLDHVPPMPPIPLLTFGESRFLMTQLENLQSFFSDTDFRVDVLQLRIPNDMSPDDETTKVLMGYTKDYTSL